VTVSTAAQFNYTLLFSLIYDIDIRQQHAHLSYSEPLCYH